MPGHKFPEPGPQRRRDADREQNEVRSGITYYALDGDKWKPGKAMYKRRQGGNGLGIGFLGAMYTLNTIDRHIAAICGGEPFRPAYIRRVCDGKDGTLIRFERRGL